MATDVPGIENVRAVGAVVADKGVVTVKGPVATLVIGAADADTYRFTADVKLSDKVRAVSLFVMPSEPTETNKPGLLNGSFYRDAPGTQVQVNSSQWDTKTNQWGRNPMVTWQ
jgi:hypothetical protein